MDIAGMEVVRKIAMVQTGAPYRPARKVLRQSVRLVTPPA
jgi:hypothetical protein